MKFVTGKWLEENKADIERLTEKLIQKEIIIGDLKEQLLIVKLESKGYCIEKESYYWERSYNLKVRDKQDNLVVLTGMEIENSDINYILSYLEKQFNQLYGRMKVNSETHNRLNNLLESLQYAQKKIINENYPFNLFSYHMGKSSGLELAIKSIKEILQDDEQCF